MNQQNNIDDLFKNSAQQFSAPAPKRVWANIDGVLKRKRKVVLFQRVLLAATVVLIASIVFFVNIDNTNTPQLVDGDIDATIETPILNINNNTTTDIKTTNVVGSDIVIEDNIIENVFIKKENNNSDEFIENVETEIVNVDTPLEELPKSNINDVEENNVLVNISPKLQTQELNIEKEVVTETIIAKNTDINIAKVESLNNIIPKEKTNAIKYLNTKEGSPEVAQVENKTSVNMKSSVKEINKEVNFEIAANSIVVNESASESKVSNSIKQETTEIVKSEESTQYAEVVESKVVELVSPEVEKIKTEEPATKLIEIETINPQEAQIAKANAIAAAYNVSERWEIDFLISQTYGIAVTNGIGKTPEIDNPSLSEAGETKAKTWFSAAVNIELDVNNWVIRSGVRRYNLEIKGDFEVKQKNPWNVD